MKTNDEREAAKRKVLDGLYRFMIEQDLESADEVYDVLVNALAQFIMASSYTQKQAKYDAKACYAGIEKSIELNWEIFGRKAIKEH